MEPLARLLRRLGILFRREKYSSELEEEMAFHREQVEKEFEAEGMDAAAAHHAAARQFGNATWLKEQSHEVVGFGFESVAQDFRFSLRQLHKNPGFAAMAILILALAICANVAIFAFVDAALIKPLPYKNVNRLTALSESTSNTPYSALSYADYVDWKDLNKVFSSVDALMGTSFLFQTPKGAEPVLSARVSAGFFRTLGVAPMLGRDFQAGEDSPSAPATVMLSYSTWQMRFGGRKDIVGQPVMLSGRPHTIIGVLPREFQLPLLGRVGFWEALQPTSECDKLRRCHNLAAIGRLKDGISIQRAAVDMKSIAAQLERQYPDSNRGQGATVVSLSEMTVGDIRPILLVLLAGAGLLLLIACVNVSSLLLVRAESRKREIAVRGALGASPMRLIRQFVTEGIVMVAVASVLSMISAYGVIRLLLSLIPTDMLDWMPYLQGLGLNLRTLGFVGFISLLAVLPFSIIPALRLSLSDLREDLAQGGRGSAGTVWRQLGSNLVIVELAITMVLLAGAGLLGKSFYRLLHVDLGFEPDRLATLRVTIPDASYAKSEQIVAAARRIVAGISSLPGVKSAGITTLLPGSDGDSSEWIRFVGRPYNGEHHDVEARDVSSDYLATMKVKLLRGRYFTDPEDESKPGVVIINKALAEKYFPGENPIGQKIGDIQLSPKSIHEIIGVVDDMREESLDLPIPTTEYLPFNQNTDTSFSVVARTSQAEGTILPAMVATIHRIDPDLGTDDEATMMEQINNSSTAYLHRSSAWLVGGFAAMALLLSVVGLYGVIAYSVSQRRREIGVRMALGAQRSTVYGMILKEAGRLIVIGIAAGILCAIGAATLMQKLLFGTRAWDASTLLTVAALLAFAAAMATYIPARRAASVNPVEALRAE